MLFYSWVTCLHRGMFTPRWSSGYWGVPQGGTTLDPLTLLLTPASPCVHTDLCSVRVARRTNSFNHFLLIKTSNELRVVISFLQDLVTRHVQSNFGSMSLKSHLCEHLTYKFIALALFFIIIIRFNLIFVLALAFVQSWKIPPVAERRPTCLTDVRSNLNSLKMVSLMSQPSWALNGPCLKRAGLRQI